MLDRNYIHKHKDAIIENCKNRGVDINIEAFLELDKKRTFLISEIDALKAKRNEHSAKLKNVTDEARVELIAEGKVLKNSIKVLEEKFADIHQSYLDLAYKIPNITHESTPIGKDESANQVVRKFGDITTFDFTPLDHETLGVKLKLIDKETAAQVTGSRFVYLKGDLVILQFALIQHVMSVLTNKDLLQSIANENNVTVPITAFTPILPPTMVKPEIMHSMGRLEPKDERYHLGEDDLYLVGSAEHTMGPIHMNSHIPEDELPIRYIGYSTAYRREAGSYGKDTKGIMRLHQFDKLEIETFTTPDNSIAEQDFIIAIQEYLMQSLGLPYRVVQKCTGDMGLPDFREYDIEAWMPGQNSYRETHTSDLMTDFQSRRLNIKVKYNDKDSEYVHMNDATVFAIGRTIIAIMENYQTKDGTINIPKVLHPYTFGKTIIT